MITTVRLSTTLRAAPRHVFPRILSSEASGSAGTPKPFQDIPGPKGYPLIGTALDYRNDKYTIFRVMEKRFAKFGPIYREKMFPGMPEQVLVYLPEDIEAVFRADQEWPDRPEGGEFTQRLLEEAGITKSGILNA